MTDPASNLDQARRYLKAIEDGDAAFVLGLFSSDASVEQLPNKIYPQGSRASGSRIGENFEKGSKIFARQSYEITGAATNGDTVALEVIWTGKLAVPFGTLGVGSEMRCHSALFMEFRDGKIVAQRNYDCFDPW
jgi:ketosteroid isomerase-like protein